MRDTGMAQVGRKVRGGVGRRGQGLSKRSPLDGRAAATVATTPEAPEAGHRNADHGEGR